ncbi:hypothetical protein OG229_02395 [Streptomyces platensis]|uniref:hypothetical protein n=1 Tax=Streptomyces platensis TaxID=58346 RepID=UPI002E15EBD2|nr:hypothetical protein OG229_02395 [Streptomyces platensis]
MAKFRRGDEVQLTHDLHTGSEKWSKGERCKVLGNRGYDEVYDVYFPARGDSLTVNDRDIKAA